MKILINGLCESAGKTTATTGLYQNLKKTKEIELFKPLAGNNYWYDNRIVSESIKKGRLFGHDAKILSELTGKREEEINPIHRLWIPNSVIESGSGLIGETQSIVLDRIFDTENKTTLVLNSRIKAPEDLKALQGNADRIEKFSTTEKFNEYMNKIHLPATKDRYERIKDRDILIIESYADIAMPIPVHADLVLTVEPGRAFISDGNKFAKAHSMISKRWTGHRMEIKTGKILDLLKSEKYRINPHPINSPEDAGEVYSPISEIVESKLKEL